jgi:hypothetical protein
MRSTLGAEFTKISLKLMKEANKLDCCITLSWIGLPGTNTLTYSMVEKEIN